MSETVQILNLIVLFILIVFGIRRLSQRSRSNIKGCNDSNDTRNQTYDEELFEECYPRDAWRLILPDSAMNHLEACFDGDKRKIAHAKRAIELSIEHFAQEMADDAECARIIEERVFKNPKPTKPLDLEELKRRRGEWLE